MSFENFILVGGSPSSGSTLLSTLLDCHPDVYSGPETNLFSHPALWNENIKVSDILNLPPSYIDIKQGITWARPSLEGIKYNNHSPLSLKDISNLPINEFIEAFFFENLDKKAIFEKSPPNAYSIPIYLKNNPKSKAIFTIRSLPSVMRSLNKRGSPDQYSIIRWLSKAHMALNCLSIFGKDRLLIVRYEDLVQHPKQVLNKVCVFSNIDPSYVEKMLTLKDSLRLTKDQSINGLSGASKAWQAIPSEGIVKTSLATPKLDIFQKALAYSIVLSQDFMYNFSFSRSSCDALKVNKLFGYGDIDISNIENLFQASQLIQKSIKTDRQKVPLYDFCNRIVP